MEKENVGADVPKSFFRTILGNHPPARHIYAIKSPTSLLLFAYAPNKIYISKLSWPIAYPEGEIDQAEVAEKLNLETNDAQRKDAECEKLKKKRVNNFDGEVLDFENTIIHMFSYENKYYVIDKVGTLFTLNQESEPDTSADCDLFDDSPPQETNKWGIRTTEKLFNELVVHSAFCTNDGKLGLLVSTSEKLSLEVVNIKNSYSIESFPVRSPGLLEINIQQTPCVLRFIPKEEIIEGFMTSWFKAGRAKSSFWLITLPDSQILALFPENGEMETLYIWDAPFLNSHWEYSCDSDCEAAGSCSLFLVSINTGVVELTDVGEIKTSYLPGPKIKAAFFDSHKHLYFSDWNDSYRQILSSLSEDCLVLPIQGILCWNEFENHVVALAKHNAVMVIDTSCEMNTAGIPEMLPESRSLADLATLIEDINQITSKISKVDNYIRAVGLENKKLKFSFEAQMVYVRREECTVHVKIKCLTEGIVIKKEEWCLILITSAKNQASSTSYHKLKNDIQSTDAISGLFTFKEHVPPNCQLTISALVLSNTKSPTDQSSPVIFIGKVCMGPENFLLPGVEADNSLIPYDPESDDSSLSTIISKKYESGETKLVINLSEDYPKDSLFKYLLSESKALWRTSFWDKACEENKLEISINNQLVTVELSQKENTKSVIICGNDAMACHNVKNALFRTAPNGYKLRTTDLVRDKKLLEDSLSSLEILEHMDQIPVQRLQELRKTLRENFTAKFTP